MHHRTLHLRDTHGFSDEDRARFAAGCRLFQAHVVCCLRELRTLGEEAPPDESYDFESPSRSDDGTVLSLRIRGVPTLGARHSFENLSCHLLSHFFPVERRRSNRTRSDCAIEAVIRQAEGLVAAR